MRTVPSLALAGLVIACSPDEILDVKDIDVALPESVADSTAVPALLAGALGNFGSAYNGGGDINMIALSGMISDEYINTETFPTRIEVDQRRQQYQSNGSLSGSFYAIQQARSFADISAENHAKFTSTADSPGMAESLNLSALSIILMAENYCGAVPLSRQLPSGAFEFGQQKSTRELLDVAILKADSVLALANAGTTQLRVARIVKARALLNLDQPAAAATAIGGTAGVPTNFVYSYIHSELSARQNNGTWNLVQNSGRFGVADLEGGVGLPFRSEGDTVTSNPIRDPRVANIRRPTNSGRGFDGATNMWWQLKYPTRAAPTVIADGVEARLIEAEADIRAGNYANALITMNNLRANTGNGAHGRGYTRTPAPLVAAVGTAAQIDQLMKERAYWLFLTSHRLGDLRRLVRPTGAAAPEISGYGRPVDTVFPNGAYHKSGTYGTDVNSPIPQAEDNNQYFNRAQCDLTKP